MIGLNRRRGAGDIGLKKKEAFPQSTGETACSDPELSCSIDSKKKKIYNMNQKSGKTPRKGKEKRGKIEPHPLTKGVT